MGRPPPRIPKIKHTITLDKGVFQKLLARVGNVSAWLNAQAKERIKLP
jgi:hypothetical protein